MKKRLKMSRTVRICCLILGWVMVVLGVIGAVLPIMPTVPFLLVASWCFARSSPRFHQWLYHHRVFGQHIKQWEEHGAIPLFVKIFATVSMAVGFLLFLIVVHPALWLALLVATVLLAIAIYMITRPSSPMSSSSSIPE
ncbi:YbaN family protein [Bartonella sp. A05]|uniref:YbaN family protein n=1 Tax=Bartonella sp. A05 TaxID=2967261 RepID=UPI0022A8FAD0|nr:YbaN family protein [Bartonella sp. A05]MCZ2203441.1 YbaN family protein [Bartonella sp. A05]